MNYLIPIATVLTTLLVQAFYFFKVKKLEEKVKGLLDEKIDDVILTMRAEIPMGSTFIRGALLDKLRNKASESVKKIIPRISPTEGGKASLLVIPWVIALLVAGATLLMLGWIG